jgi:hypothetical protein
MGRMARLGALIMGVSVAAGVLPTGAQSPSEIQLADDTEPQPFPGYEPKLTPDTTADFRPSLRIVIETLPEATPENLGVLLRSLVRYRAEAQAMPGVWTAGDMPLGADEQEYVPTDAELLLSEVGGRVRDVIAALPPDQATRVLTDAGFSAPIEYPAITFRHVDVMGSGRYFYASGPTPTRIDVATTAAAAAPAAASAPPRPAITGEELAAMTTERQADYLAGVADGLNLAAAWPADRVRMLAGCVAGFDGEALAEIYRRRSAEPRWQSQPADEPISAQFALIMAEECQLPWTAP